jgi:hypothetical protein
VNYYRFPEIDPQNESDVASAKIAIKSPKGIRINRITNSQSVSGTKSGSGVKKQD